MKTIREWLEQLPEPYRTQALGNAKKTALTVKVHNVHWALKGAFVWAMSKEGQKYWEDVYMYRTL